MTPQASQPLTFTASEGERQGIGSRLILCVLEELRRRSVAVVVTYGGAAAPPSRPPHLRGAVQDSRLLVWD
jgi:hypothetical protein